MENEFKKMQKIAGLITENQNSTSSKKIRFEDMVDLVVDNLNFSLEDDEQIGEKEIAKIQNLDDLISLITNETALDEEDVFVFIIKSIVE